MRKKILFKDEDIAHEIERRIEEERLKEGDRVPSERQLADDFGVQRDTVRCALEILLRRGVLEKKPRQGYYVAAKRIRIELDNLHVMKNEIEKIGRANRAILLNYEMISMNSRLSETTGMPEGTPCYQILRLRYDDNRPISFEKSYLIAEHVPGLKHEDFENRSLASVLRQRYGISMETAKQRLTQVYAGDPESELLKISKGGMLVRYEGLIYDRKGRLIEAFDNVVIPDSIEFHIRDYA